MTIVGCRTPCVGTRCLAGIADVEVGQARRLTMDDSVTAVAFEPSGQRLIVAHFHTVCIIDRLSGVKLHETPLMGPVREVLALSWINESNH